MHSLLRQSLNRIALVTTLLLTVAIACGGGGDTATSDGQSATDETAPGGGRAVKGPVMFGVVTIHALNADGSRGAALYTTTTDSDGNFSLRSYVSGPLEIVITGGSYIDEATGATVDMTGRQMTAVIADYLGRGRPMAVTPLTSAAATQARQRIANGESVIDAITTSNTNVADQFGLAGVDITSVRPTDLTDATEESIPGADATNYAAAIAALSQNGKDGGLSPEQILDLAENIGEDLSDGALDDSNGGAALSNALPVSSSQTVNDIEQKADDFLNSSQNQSGVEPGQVTLKEPTATPTTSPTPSPAPADVTAPTTVAALAEQSKTPTSWTGNATIDEAGTGYITALVNGSAAPTAAEIIANNNVNKVGVGCNVTLAANVGAACAVNGLTSQTTYDFYFVAKDGSGNVQSDAVAAASKVTAATPDGTPPTTTGALAQSANNPFTWSGTATIDENGVGYCAAVANGAAAPTPSQVKSGAGGGVQGTRGQVAMTANAQATCTVTGLTDQTAYDFYFVAQDAIPNLQVGLSGPVTATTPDGTAPTTDVAFAQNAITNTTWTGQASLNEAGTGYITALTAGSAAPTAAEVAADSNANKAGTGCSVAMGTPATTYTCQVTGLTEGGTYDFYFVAKDTANNFQSDGTAAAQKVAGVTTPDGTAPTTDVAWSQQSNTAGTSWTGQASLNEAGTGYCTALVDGSAAPTAAEVKADNNANKAGTGGSVAMGTPATTYTCTVTGLSEQTAYDFYFVAQDTAANLQNDGTAAAAKVDATTPDVTPPVVDVAWAQQANTAGTSWTGQASLNEAGTGYCTALTSGAGAPTVAEVKADNNANKAGTGGSVAMGTPATTYTCTVTGLSEQTAYDFYFVAQDTAGTPNLTVAVSGPVAATTPDVSPPTFDVAWSQQSNSAGTSWSGQASLDEAGTGYCVAVPNGGGAPTAAQIKAAAGGAIVGTGGSVAMGTPATTYTCTVTGLSEQTAYDFYFVAQDDAASPNLMAAGSGPVSATTPDLTPPVVDVAWAQQANTAGTSWTGQASLNEAGTGYCTALTSGAGAPTVAEVKADNNANKAGTGGSVAMGTPATTYTCTVTGLSEQTAYDFYFVAQDTAGTPNLTVAVSGPVAATTPDVSPPTFDVAFATSTNTSGTSFGATGSLNEAGTVWCTALTTGSAAPTPAQVKANNNANKVGTGGSTAMGVAANSYECTVTGLTTGATYDFYYYAEDTPGNTQLQATVTATKITAAATDLTPPTFDVAFATTTNTSGTALGATGSLNEPGQVWCTALASGSAAPTPAQVKANNNANKVGTGGNTNMPVAANSYECTVTGLTASTTYDFYYYAEDTPGNTQLQAAVTASKISVATAAGCVGQTSNVAGTGTGAFADGATKSISFAVTKPVGCGSVADVNLTVNITHTITADLDVKLTSPAATNVFSLDNTTNAGSVDGTNGLPGVTFDDASGTTIADCFTGSPNNYQCNGAGGHNSGITLKGQNLLSGFNNEVGNGTWTMSVIDWGGNATGGTVNSASIFITWQP
jgi:subtilisin-like proprotein convertase family protein